MVSECHLFKDYYFFVHSTSPHVVTTSKPVPPTSSPNNTEEGNDNH